MIGKVGRTDNVGGDGKFGLGRVWAGWAKLVWSCEACRAGKVGGTNKMDRANEVGGGGQGCVAGDVGWTGKVGVTCYRPPFLNLYS